MLPSSAAGTTAATTSERCQVPFWVKRASSTPIGIRLKSDVMPLHASATNSDSPSGSCITLPSRSTGTPNTCSTPTAPALANICSFVTIGSTIDLGQRNHEEQEAEREREPLQTAHAPAIPDQRGDRADQREPLERDLRRGGAERVDREREREAEQRALVSFARPERANSRVRGREGHHRHEEAVLEVLG